MGLLSDPAYGSAAWVRVVRRVQSPVCALCVLAALLWFVLLAHPDFNNDTYFSENALLPGLVTNEFDAESSAKQFHKEFIQELEDKYSETEEIPVPWLVGKMSQLHLEVYTHNFTLNYPLGHGQVYTGTNVYGILRAARTASLEALVLAAPFRPLSSHQKGTTAGIALMLAFAQFARLQKYWAKDIIFLVTEHEHLGMQAWLEAYHGLHSDAETFHSSLGSFWAPGTPSLNLGKWLPDWMGDHKKCLDQGVLKGRSGSIQAAINLEFHIPNVKYVEVKVEGLNGQLPNLDLVNLVHKLCVKAGVHHSFKNSYSWIRHRSKSEEWASGLRTMLGMMTAQIAGVPNGNHGLFHRFGVEAVTLEGRAEDDPGGRAPRAGGLGAASWRRLGLALESVLRSLNNLLERFHQSYFFYLRPATNRFISIGQYMPSVCLLCVALLVKGLASWVAVQPESEEGLTARPGPSDEQTRDTDKRSIGRGQVANEEVPGDRTTEQAIDREPKKTAEEDLHLVNVGVNFLFVHLFGYFVMKLPLPLSRLGAHYLQLPSERAVFYGLGAVCAAGAGGAPLVPRLLRVRGAPAAGLWRALALLELAAALLALAVHNVALGLALAALYAPLGLLAEPARRLRPLRRALCLVRPPTHAPVRLARAVVTGPVCAGAAPAVRAERGAGGVQCGAVPRGARGRRGPGAGRGRAGPHVLARRPADIRQLGVQRVVLRAAAAVDAAAPAAVDPGPPGPGPLGPWAPQAPQAPGPHRPTQPVNTYLYASHMLVEGHVVLLILIRTYNIDTDLR